MSTEDDLYARLRLAELDIREDQARQCENFIYVPLDKADERVAQNVPMAVINTVATIGEWRSWYVSCDAEGNSILIEDGHSEGWDQEWWNEQMRIKNGSTGEK
jgi:hypothetical protein